MKEHQYNVGDLVKIKNGRHSLNTDFLGTIINIGVAGTTKRFADVAGVSTIHPNRVIVNTLEMYSEMEPA